MQWHLSDKRNVVLYLYKNLIEKSRELGFNLLKTFENHLKHMITQFSSINQPSNCENNVNSGFLGGRRDSNPNRFKSQVAEIGKLSSEIKKRAIDAITV